AMGRIGLAQRPAANAQSTPKPSPAKASTPRSPAAARAHAPLASAADHNAVIKRYCVTCHTEARKPGGLSLRRFDVARGAETGEVAERVIRKLQAGMMPPPGMPRPDAATQQAILSSLETTIDTAAGARPNPGGRTFPRLNRPEYASAIQELLG